MEKINVTQLIAKVERVETESGNITADVRTQSGSVIAVENGSIRDTTGNQVATFGCYNTSLNINYQTDTDRAETLAVVEEFIEAVKGGEA